MLKRRAGYPAGRLVTALAILWAMAIGLTAAGNRPATPEATRVSAAPASPVATASAPQANGFVGDDTCSTCHDSEAKGLHLSLHGKAQNARTPAAKTNQSCESCHGPGQAHVDTGDKTKIKRFTAMSARDVNATCLSCHTKSSHADFEGGMHAARNVSCATCHSVHSPKSDRAQLKTVTAVETCQTCHKQEAMKVKKSGHMPVREGKMDCTTCHTPHGSSNVRMLKTGNTMNETCASCHDPHGSNNDRMLVAKEPMLCQRCHVSSRHPATIYDGTQIAAASNRAIGRSCVNCHSQIHGSNHPAGDKYLR